MVSPSPSASLSTKSSVMASQISDHSRLASPHIILTACQAGRSLHRAVSSESIVAHLIGCLGVDMFEFSPVTGPCMDFVLQQRRPFQACLSESTESLQSHTYCVLTNIANVLWVMHQEGDIVNVDVSALYKGYHGDLNETYLVGNCDEASRKLVSAAYQVGCPAAPCQASCIATAHSPVFDSTSVLTIVPAAPYGL